MADKEPQLQFDFESYIASLMEAMNMAEAPIEVQKEVTLQLGRQVGYRIMNTLTLNFGAQDWAALANDKSTENLSDLISEAIEQSPKIKDKVVEELDQFYKETLEAFYFMR